MDGFAVHPYPDNSSTSPGTANPRNTSIGLADYDKLVGLLAGAFDGTPQAGSTLPILYDEFGIESIVPEGKRSLYSGTEPTTTKPVDESKQAAAYDIGLKLAFCQPNVAGILLFHSHDEEALLSWQSGVYYADGTPKSSLEAVKAAADRVRRNLVACSGLKVTPRLGVRWFPRGRPTAVASTFPISLTCDVDCLYRIRIERASTHTTTLSVAGHATGRVATMAAFRRTRLRPGSYRITVWASARANVGPPATAASPVFTVKRL